MKHLRFALVVLGLIWMTACSSSNSTDTPLPALDTEKFSVSLEEGNGTFNPVLDVKEQGNTTTVTVTATNAQALGSALVHLKYDETQYTPETVEFGDFLGGKDDVITLAVTDIAGEVPLGVVQITDGNAAPQNGSGVIATVTFTNTPFTGGRSASAYPTGQQNAVQDLEIVSQGGGQAYLRWTEVNKGDYDNNGLVGISDLTPMADYFNGSVADASDPIHAGLVDGDKNGMITLGDLSVIGGNFGNQLTGYWVFKDAAGSDPLKYVERPAGIDTKKPVIYNVQVDFAGTEQLTVRGVGTTDVELGEESNVAEYNIVPGAPEPPTNLNATAGIGVGNLRIRLTWQASPTGDVEGYEVERKLASDPDSAFAFVAGPILGLNYVDQGGLTDDDYSYRVRAIDKEFPAPNYSTYTATATAHPYVKQFSAPENLSVAPAAGAPVSIKVDWDAPADESAERYTVYRQAPGEPGFTAVFTTLNVAVSEYTDGGLSEGETYNYYVTSRDSFLTQESAPSSTESSVPSDATILDIQVTTDKTTHHTSGSEPASNITAVSNTPGTSFVWSATSGTITGSGASVTWKPAAGATPGAATITCNATAGPQSDSAVVKMVITSLTIKTSHADRGGGGNIPVGTPSGSGKTSPLTLTPFQYLAPLSQNPSKTITTYTGTLAQFMAGKVTLLDRWELWCGPCKAEFPEIDDYAETYAADGYIQVSLSNDTSPSYSCAQIANWFDSNGIDFVHQFFDDGTDNGMDAFWDTMGYDYYIPYNVLTDRDGNVRKTGGAAYGWDVDIEQLCGI